MPENLRFDVRLPRGTIDKWPGAPHGLGKKKAEAILFEGCRVWRRSVGNNRAEKVLESANLLPSEDLNHRPEHEIQELCCRFVDDNQDLFRNLAGAFQKSEEKRLEVRQALWKLLVAVQLNRRGRWKETQAMKSQSRDNSAVETTAPRMKNPSDSIRKSEEAKETICRKSTIKEDGKINAAPIPPVTAPVLDDMATLDIVVYNHGSDTQVAKWSPLLEPVLYNKSLESADAMKLWEGLWDIIRFHLHLETSPQIADDKNRQLWTGAHDGEVKGNYLSTASDLKQWLKLCAKNGRRLTLILILKPNSSMSGPWPRQSKTEKTDKTR
ncbi:MAG: hypothetical protein Q9160_007672 [Pyrenula sp. 1 TL-2023]